MSILLHSSLLLLYLLEAGKKQLIMMTLVLCNHFANALFVACPVNIITVESVRLFSQRAGAYMLAYQVLREEEKGLSLTTWT
jgi:hypothetical protein